MIGSTVSHYKILEEVGRGGMGVVYKALDTRLDRVVALKFLPRDLMRDPVAKTRFVHEAKAASALDHSHICTIYEIGEAGDGQMFIAMAYYEGRSLKEHIEEGALPVETALVFATQLADALAKAHENGIIHRDIKPANIVITKDGQVKLVDFGLAKVAEQTLITVEGSTLGTTSYMSPEQAQGETIDARTDQWSLGAVIYEMLTGKRAFRGAYPQAVIYSILNEEPQSIRELTPELPADLVSLVDRTLEKNPEERFTSVDELFAALEQMLLRERGMATIGSVKPRRRWSVPRLPQYVLPVVAVVIVLVTAAFWYVNRQAGIRHAHEVLMPRIEELMESSWSDYVEVYRLAEEAEEYIPDDPRLEDVMAKSTFNIDVQTEPSGAEVYLKPYANPEEDWRYLGTSPIESLQIPIGVFRWKLEKEGFETALATAASWNVDIAGDTVIIPHDFFRALDERGSLPEGMVRVPGFQYPDGTQMGDFFIDRTEVTNRQFKEFVDAGGYRNRDLWTHEFLKDDTVLSWEEAMAEFTDLTGRQGPANWQVGFYPDGEDNFPVSGLSWYEAAAYAAWKGKDLPTEKHWGRARGDRTPLIQFPQLGGFGTLAPFTNFTGDGPVSVASLGGFTSFGAHDMAGNVREWCWNETPGGRLIRGGAWSDNHYFFFSPSQAPAFDRSERNGFRLVVYPDRETLSDAFFGTTNPPSEPDYASIEPASDAEFEIYREQFQYDANPLASLTDRVDDSSEAWTLEQVSYNAPYGDDRIIAHLFLPKNASPPYQTVIYFPGIAVRYQSSSVDIETYYEFTLFLSFIVKSGRAVLFPVYQGTFERKDPEMLARLFRGLDLLAYTNLKIQQVKDYRRSIDYLETRDDIDTGRLAFYGMSMGGIMGPIITAVDDRLRASVLLAGGVDRRVRSTIWNFHYAPRVTIPTLMLGGTYDSIFPADAAQRPLFEMLGTPDEHKELKLYPTDHIPPMNEVIRETLAWLDRYLGPVE